jgi:hypothetical protein
MTKKVFNLSIKDLKEILGVVKKKKRRKRNKKNINKINNGVRSSSNHMVASSSFIPTNVNTLQNDNLHLINQQLQNKINLDKEIKQDDNQLVVSNKKDDIKKLQNDMNSMKEQGMKYISDLYTKTYQKPTNLSNIKSKNIDVSNVLRADTFDDNIDVGTTSGDDTFQNLKTDQTESFITPIKKEAEVEVEVPQTPTNISYDKVYETDEIPKETNETIQKTENIPKETNPMNESNFEKKKKIYTDLCLEKDIIPKQSVLDSNNAGTINAAIKIIDPVFYNSYIKRKSNKKKSK